MKNLVRLMRDNRAILFVGSGVSKNLGLPTYAELINEMARQLGFDPRLFNDWGNNDFLILAEYYYHHKGSLKELIAWMDSKWHNSTIDIGQSLIHQLIVELDFPLIYTTNYDKWLEHAYDYYKKEYEKITNVADMARANASKPQIVKFHGDFDDESSIVLTESQFFNRLDFETPLDIKLRSDSLEKSLLFVGYSLSDINIRYMLYKLHKQWELSSYEALRPKSYIFLVESNPIKEKILTERGIIPIVSKIDDPGESLTAFLSELKSMI